MRSLILAFLTLFSVMFTSCEDKYVSAGREMYENYFRETLNDPESFVVYNETYKADGMIIEWTIDYGAKNKLGGMVRKTSKITTIYPNTIEVDGKLQNIK